MTTDPYKCCETKGARYERLRGRCVRSLRSRVHADLAALHDSLAAIPFRVEAVPHGQREVMESRTQFGDLWSRSITFWRLGVILDEIFSRILEP